MRTCLVTLALAAVAIVACKRSPPPAEQTEPAPSASEAEPTSEQPAGDASRRAARDAEPGVDRLAHVAGDAGTIDPACTAPGLDLAAVVVDPRCAIGSALAKQLLAVLQQDGGAPKLTQDAKLTGDGRVALRLVNVGRSPVTLPLSWHPKVQAFTALAEDDKHVLYELEAPKLDVPEGAEPKAHFARIVLASGGFAVARVAISPVVTKRIAPSCPEDGGTCAPPRLPHGKYALYVGQLVADIEAGAPARVEWQVP